MTEGYAHNLDHLRDELTRLDLLLERAARRAKQSRGKEVPAGPYISEQEVQALLSPGFSAEAGADLPQGDPLWDQIEQHAEMIRRKIAESKERGVRLRLPRLARIFGLSPFEMDVVLICLAPEMDLKYQRLYGFLLDDATRRHPSLALILKVLCLSFDEEMRARASFALDAPLSKYRLIALLKDPADLAVPLPAQQIKIDEGIAGYLLNATGLDPAIATHSSIKGPADLAEDGAIPARCNRRSPAASNLI